MQLLLKNRSDGGNDVEIALFPESSPRCAEIDNGVLLIESAKYELTLKVSDEEVRDVARIIIELNEEDKIAQLIPYKSRSVLYYPSDSLKDQDLRERTGAFRYFVGQVDLVRFSLSVHYSRPRQVEKLLSPYYICAFENEENEANVDGIIKSVLNFEDEYITAHLYAANGESAQDGSAYVKGALETVSYKSAETVLHFVKKILSCYGRHLPYFHRKAHHQIVTTQSLVPVDKVRQVSPDALYHLAQTPENISKLPTKNECDVFKSCRGNMPLFMESLIERRSYDVYENRVCCAFLKRVYRFMRQLVHRLKDSHVKTQEFLAREWGIKEGYLAPVLILKEKLQVHQQSMLSQAEGITDDLNRLVHLYSKILQCKVEELYTIPRATKVFLSNPVYHEIFSNIVHWFQDGEFNTDNFENIFRIRSMSKLYEIFTLQKLLQLFIEKGFVLDKAHNSRYQYPLVSQKFPKAYLVSNTYKMHRGSVSMTLYYEPSIYNFVPEGDFADKMPNDLELYRVDEQDIKNNYYEPDFVLKVESEGKISYAIFDCKYSFTGAITRNLREALDESPGHLLKTINKYYRNTVAFNGAAIRMVWTLQGRIDPECSFYTYGKLKSPNTQYKPSVSFGNCPVNSDAKKNDIALLWREMCLMIPVLADAESSQQFSDVQSEAESQFGGNASIIPEETHPANKENAELVASNATQLKTELSPLEYQKKKASHGVQPKSNKNIASPKHIDSPGTVLKTDLPPKIRGEFFKAFWTDCSDFYQKEPKYRNKFRLHTPPHPGPSYTIFNQKNPKTKLQLKLSNNVQTVEIVYTKSNLKNSSSVSSEDKRKKISESIKKEVDKVDKSEVSDIKCSYSRNDLSLTLSYRVDLSDETNRREQPSSLIKKSYLLLNVLDKLLV